MHHHTTSEQSTLSPPLTNADLTSTHASRSQPHPTLPYPSPPHAKVNASAPRLSSYLQNLRVRLHHRSQCLKLPSFQKQSHLSNTFLSPLLSHNPHIPHQIKASSAPKLMLHDKLPVGCSAKSPKPLIQRLLRPRPASPAQHHRPFPFISTHTPASSSASSQLPTTTPAPLPPMPTFLPHRYCTATHNPTSTTHLSAAPPVQQTSAHLTAIPEGTDPEAPHSVLAKQLELRQHRLSAPPPRLLPPQQDHGLRELPLPQLQVFPAHHPHHPSRHPSEPRSPPLRRTSCMTTHHHTPTLNSQSPPPPEPPFHQHELLQPLPRILTTHSPTADHRRPCLVFQVTTLSQPPHTY